MKFRSDFVTNSSSSSFICEVCGTVESGWDMCLSDANMVECENGHTFCEDELLSDVDYTAMAKRIVEKEGFRFEWYKNDSETNEEFAERVTNDEDDAKSLCRQYGEDYVPQECCPICTRDHIREHDLINFATDKLGITRADLIKMTRAFLLEQDKLKK